tara:strand:- start:108 stop:209 length:102 start_codon:yes stop_codon:yes gene_type:complete
MAAAVEPQRETLREKQQGTHACEGKKGSGKAQT